MKKFDGKTKYFSVRVIVVVSWLTILYVGFMFFSNVTVANIAASVSSVQEYRGWLWLVVLISLAMLLRGLRWVIIFCSSLEERKNISVLYHGWFFVLSMMSIFRTGEVLRVVWLQERGMHISASLSYIFIEKLSDAFLLALLMSISMLFVEDKIGTVSLLVCFAVIFLYGAIAIFGASVYKAVCAFDSKLGRRYLSAFLGFAEDVLEHCLILGGLHANISIIVFSAAIWSIVVLAFHVFIVFQFPEMPLYASAIIVVMVNLTGFLNLSPANIGPFELSVAVVLIMFDVKEEDASVFAVILHSMIIFATILYGLCCRISISLVTKRYEAEN